MKVFDLQGNGTNFIAEILAGITTFITMSYLLVQCPAMLSGDLVSAPTLYIAICLTCCVGCLAMGFWARQPFVVGPSIGLFAYFSSVLMTDMKYDYSQALAVVFLASVVFVVLSLTGFGGIIYSSIPGGLKNGISAGLGLYIALIGLKNSGFLVTSENGSFSLADFSDYNLQLFNVLIMFAGVIIIGLLKKFGLPFPTLLGLVASCALYYGVGIYLIRVVDKSALHFQLGGFNENFGAWYGEGFLKSLTTGIGGVLGGLTLDVKAILTFIITIIVSALFNATESTGVIYAIAKNNGKLDDNGNFGALKTSLSSNSIASVTGSLMGCPMVAVAPESAAGFSAQGKSGLTAVTAGALFLLASFFAPVATFIPASVTSCILVYLGVNMMGAVKDIDFGNIGDSVPALLIIVLIPFTSSIVDGIALGIILHIVINLLMLNFKAIKPLEAVIAVLFGISYFYI